VVIDSFVLILRLDTTYQIGDTSAAVSLRVLGATSGTIAVDEPLTSTPLVDNGVVYGEVTTVPNRAPQAVNVFFTDSLAVDTIAPELRIPLNQDFSDAFLNAIAMVNSIDTVINDSLFRELFNGIIIEASDCSTNLPAISLNPSRDARLGVFVYYTQDGSPRQYQFSFRRGGSRIGSLRPEYIHNYVGTPAAQLLAGNTLNDTLAIVQSLSGLRVKVDFPDLSSLNRQAVNAAILELPLRPGSGVNIRPLPRILVRVENASGDIINYSASAADGTIAYRVEEGGNLIEVPDPTGMSSDSVSVYRFNLTTFFQDVVDGSRVPEIYLVAEAQTQLPGETILVGPGGDADALKARLLLATTELP
jgi:hypothetical protein